MMSNDVEVYWFTGVRVYRYTGTLVHRYTKRSVIVQ